MKKKGFTLVELLGVIVVLAIIALIAVPTIIGAIDKSRKRSLQNSGYGLVEAGTLYYAHYQNSKTVRFDIKDNKITSKENNKLSYKGTVKEGTVLINHKGEVVVCINDGKYAAYKNFKDNKVTIVDNKTCTIPENSNIVYLDKEATIDINIEELISKMNQMEQRIEELEHEKASQLDMTNAISNVTTTHTTDVNSVNTRLHSIENNISKIGSTIIKASNGVSGGYVEFSNGLKMAWGDVGCVCNTTNFNFPITFTEKPYVILQKEGSIGSNNTLTLVEVIDSTTTGFSMHGISYNNGSWVEACTCSMNYIAMGH